MKPSYLILCALVISSYLNAQQPIDSYNFENMSGDSTKWSEFGTGKYTTGIDAQIAYEGDKSAFISSDGSGGEFKAWSYTLPAIKDGKKIKLTAYIKTENVANGWAGVWMRIDPSVDFDNMQDQELTGTNDWKEYSVELKLDPARAENIVFGGILAGDGKMWVDNLQISIDGKPYSQAPPKQLSKAQKDTEFDEASRITLGKMSPQQLENTELLGKIWGFLKYHHPTVATGDINWDYELFRNAEPIINAANGKVRDGLILKWIDSYGEVPACKRCEPVDVNLPVLPSNDWMTDSKISEELRVKLNYIYENRHQGKHYYIGTYPGVGNPKFINENPYTDMNYPDSGFRLLALYRYWNMIHYYFPYKNDADKDWNTVLREYIPRFIGANDELEYEIAAIQLIGDIQDTHANLWGGGDKYRETKGANFPPIRVKFIENQLVAVDYFNPEKKAEIGLEVGDVINKINGVEVADIIKQKTPYYPASNEAARLRDIAMDILRSDESQLSLRVETNAGPKTITMPLFEPSELDMYSWYRVNKDEKCHKLLDNNIGYVSLANIQQEDLEVIKENYMDTKGMIIDIRNYPSTFVVFTLGRYFAQGRNEFVKFTKADLKTPGAFEYTEPLKVGQNKREDKMYQGKVIVLVNELSQSQAEYTAMAFRGSPNTVVIGSTTAGADGNVSTIYLPGGLRTMISGIGVFYPDGKPTQRVGIVPDIYLEPTLKGIREGRDELLERAIEEILK